MAKGEKLTPAFVKSAAAPTDGKAYAIHYDTLVKGFGLRVTKSGAKAWVLNYRARGIERRLTIGDANDWPVAAARGGPAPQAARRPRPGSDGRAS
jgi:hypothetical protein